MNKKGFTLVELLAVIMILSIVMLIAYSSSTSVSKRVKEKNTEEKVAQIISSAKIYGEDHKDKLGTVITVKTLLDSNYYESSERNGDNVAVLNDVTGRDLSSLTIKIYRHNTRVYACIEDNAENRDFLGNLASKNYCE